jgi:hypothetical protein
MSTNTTSIFKDLDVARYLIIQLTSANNCMKKTLHKILNKLI